MRLLPLPLLAALLLTAGPAPGQQPTKQKVVIFKDGFVVRGKITRPTTYIFDKGGASFTIPVTGGFFRIDDEVRAIAFAPNQVHDVIDDESFKDLVRVGNVYSRASGDPMPSRWSVDKVSPFDNRLERIARLNVPGGWKDIPQRVVAMTPRFVRLQARGYEWMCAFSPRELGPDTVRSLLVKHALLTGMPKEKFKQRMLIYRYMLQAGWTDQSEKELEDMIETFPAERKKLEGVKENLDRLIAAHYVEEIEQAHKVGQHADAQERLTRFYQQMTRQAPPESLLKAQALKNKYSAAEEKINDARRFLKALVPLVNPLQSDYYKEATEAILTGLTYDTVARLETFLGQALNDERARKQNRAVQQRPEELLAFAISGWLLGDGAAERSPDNARRLWLARQLVLRVQRDPDPVGRKMKAKAFADTKSVAVDLVARMIPQLPPPEPYEKLGGELLKMTATAGRATYHLQLPPEYNHYRAYPVLIALHHSGETAADEAKRWTELAGKYGFLVAAPEWGKGKKSTYSYSEREHDAVLGTLRDLRQRFQIDSDRVFLFGSEEGAKAAYDVGLAHPDLFAGVLPMSGSPAYYPFRYWSNAQHLPFYVVNGEWTGKLAKDTQALFKDWIRSHYPSLLVEYKGRPAEFFIAEGEPMFNWMSRKKRITPLRQAGRAEEEFKTMRPTDNRFYWLSTEQVLPRFQNNVQNWNPNLPAATMRALISRDNHLIVNTHGLGQLTVWLGPGMLNYDQKVRVLVNSRVLASQMVVPSLVDLLDDFARMGDRQRLFWARIDLNL